MEFYHLYKSHITCSEYKTMELHYQFVKEIAKIAAFGQIEFDPDFDANLNSLHINQMEHLNSLTFQLCNFYTL